MTALTRMRLLITCQHLLCNIWRLDLQWIICCHIKRPRLPYVDQYINHVLFSFDIAFIFQWVVWIPNYFVASQNVISGFHIWKHNLIFQNPHDTPSNFTASSANLINWNYLCSSTIQNVDGYWCITGAGFFGSIIIGLPGKVLQSRGNCRSYGS